LGSASMQPQCLCGRTRLGGAGDRGRPPIPAAEP
jgi:hypothetical protein